MVFKDKPLKICLRQGFLKKKHPDFGTILWFWAPPKLKNSAKINIFQIFLNPVKGRQHDWSPDRNTWQFV